MPRSRRSANGKKRRGVHTEVSNVAVPGQTQKPLWRSLLFVFLAALAIRIVHVWQLSDAPIFTHLLGDSRGYDEWGRRIAAGDWIGRGVFYQAPLYPYLLGGVYATLGHNLLVVRLLQAVVGASSCVLIAAAARNWFGRRAALVSGLLFAAYAPAIFFDALIQKSVLDALLVAGLLFALSANSKFPAGVLALLTGTTFGLLVLTRENALALLPVIAAIVWVRSARRLSPVLVTIAAAAAVLAPAAIRNVRVGGEFHLTTSQLGPNFYIGNGPRATGVYVPLEADRGTFEFEREDATELAQVALGRRLSPSEVSGYWLGRGLDWIGANPGAWLRLTGRKTLLLVNGTEAADTEDIATHAERSILLRATASVVHFGLVAPLALVGAWITRRRWRELWPLYALVATLALTVLAFYVMNRYRYPLAVPLVLFAGAAAAEIPAYWRTHTGWERARIAALFAAGVVLCNWPVLSPSDMQALTHYNLGNALSRAHLDDQAEAEYRTAIGLEPDLPGPHVSLGALLGAKGDQAGALLECREAVRLDPQSSAAHVNLGVLLGSTGSIPESVSVLTRAVDLDPRNADAHYNLAKALAALGQTEPAVEHLRETIRLQPSRSLAYNNLGILLCRQGRFAEGIDQLRTAVRLDPTSSEAAANLEHALRLAPQAR